MQDIEFWKHLFQTLRTVICTICQSGILYNIKQEAHRP